MSRKAMLGLTAAVALIGLMAAAVAVSASDSISTARTISVVLKNRQVGVVDLPPKGPSQGDMRITHAPLFNAHETKRVGNFEAVCTLTRPPAASHQQEITLCDYAVSFGRDEITLETRNLRQGLNQPPRRDVAAVTGGTGIYQNVRGELHLRVPRGDERDLVFHLIP